MPPPDAWEIVARDLWYLPETEARACWMALEHAPRSRPVAMRQRCALAGYTHISDRFWADCCAPPVVMAVLEDRCREGRLSRQRTTKIEEVVLRHVDRSGVWHGDRPGEERRSIHPPDVVLFHEVGKPEPTQRKEQCYTSQS